ncbi:MAG: hypothetical protein PVH41_01210 [Anaerolineae bacterium]|jgi:hypothetical protein
MSRATYHFPAAFLLGVVTAAPQVVGSNVSDERGAWECSAPIQRYRGPVQAGAITPQLIGTCAPDLRTVRLPGLDQ